MKTEQEQYLLCNKSYSDLPSRSHRLSEYKVGIHTKGKHYMYYTLYSDS